MAGSVVALMSVASSVCVGTPSLARSLHGPCELVRDPAGDAQMVPGVADPSDTGTGSMDIVSGDVASNATLIGVAVRVVNLRAAGSVAQDRGYEFWFDSAGQTFVFTAEVPANGSPSFEVSAGPKASSPNGDDSYDTYNGTGIAVAHGVVDVTHNEIRMTARLKDVLKATRLTSPVKHLRVATWRGSPTPQAQAGYREDLAHGDPQYGDRYRLGENSCLTPGLHW